MERTNIPPLVQCDGCGVTEPKPSSGALPEGWAVVERDDELLCAECVAGMARVRQVNATLAFMAQQEKL